MNTEIKDVNAVVNRKYLVVLKNTFCYDTHHYLTPGNGVHSVKPYAICFASIEEAKAASDEFTGKYKQAQWASVGYIEESDATANVEDCVSKVTPFEERKVEVKEDEYLIVLNYSGGYYYLSGDTGWSYRHATAFKLEAAINWMKDFDKNVTKLIPREPKEWKLVGYVKKDAQSAMYNTPSITMPNLIKYTKEPIVEVKKEEPKMENPKKYFIVMSLTLSGATQLWYLSSSLTSGVETYGFAWCGTKDAVDKYIAEFETKGRSKLHDPKEGWKIVGYIDKDDAQYTATKSGEHAKFIAVKEEVKPTTKVEDAKETKYLVLIQSAPYGRLDYWWVGSDAKDGAAQARSATTRSLKQFTLEEATNFVKEWDTKHKERFKAMYNVEYKVADVIEADSVYALDYKCYSADATSQCKDVKRVTISPTKEEKVITEIKKEVPVTVKREVKVGDTLYRFTDKQEKIVSGLFFVTENNKKVVLSYDTTTGIAFVWDYDAKLDFLSRDELVKEYVAAIMTKFVAKA